MFHTVINKMEFFYLSQIFLKYSLPQPPFLDRLSRGRVPRGAEGDDQGLGLFAGWKCMVEHEVRSKGGGGKYELNEGKIFLMGVRGKAMVVFL